MSNDDANSFRAACRLAPATIAAIGLLLAAPLAAQGPPPKLHASYTVEGDLAGKKKGSVATDISGIACMDPPGSGSFRCLLVNDEGTLAEFVTIAGNKMTPGKRVAELIGKAPDPGTLGAPPKVSCPDLDMEFKEFDGEGVAYHAPHYYIVGSHGCSRKKGKFKLSSFLLARMRVDATGALIDRNGQAVAANAKPASYVETTYRLGEALEKAAHVGAFFGKDLNSSDGLNIEGIAVANGKLIAGLRAPSRQGLAYLVIVPLAELFAPGNAPSIGSPEVVALALGQQIGVRDLAPLPDGRLLVLAGPTQDQALPHALFAMEPKVGGRLTALGAFEPFADGRKAEAVTVLAVEGTTARVLVLFDGPDNGSPREYRVTLKN